MPAHPHSSDRTPGGSVPALLGPEHGSSIAQSHERCRALGVEEDRLPDLSPVPPARLKEMRELNRRLCEHAAPIMEMLFEQIVSTRSIVVLTDTRGTILHSIGDDQFLDRAQQIALAPGVNWSEPTKGTNAIGTALFDEAPTVVHGGEHYIRANRFLTCSAAPIFDHAGRVLGVLDVTGEQRSYHPHTLAMVAMSARLIENHWFSDRFRHGLRLHFADRPERLGTVREGMVAVSPDGAILGANRYALAQLGMSAAALRVRGLESVFGVSLPELADHCRRRADEPLVLHVTDSQGSTRMLHARAFFHWPTRWPARVGAPAAPPRQAMTGHSPPPHSAIASPTASTVEVPQDRSPAASGEAAPAGATLESLELQAIERALAACGGNVSRAARQLGIGRNTIYRKLKRLRGPSAPA
ncbi:MAG TPA: helix-turn-helix domain-containing protein [Burkholderiaceae bacterium]|nr:helix-turn-helix domain-containing protein [Burkholderiaceae bacterium]